MELDLTILVPGTPEAAARGCICPDNLYFSVPGPLFACGGHYFDPSCPVHRNAILAELQRMFGRPQ